MQFFIIIITVAPKWGFTLLVAEFLISFSFLLLSRIICIHWDPNHCIEILVIIHWFSNLIYHLRHRAKNTISESADIYTRYDLTGCASMACSAVNGLILTPDLGCCSASSSPAIKYNAMNRAQTETGSQVTSFTWSPSEWSHCFLTSASTEPRGSYEQQLGTTGIPP